MQFISYDGATEMSSDQEKGLDGIITENDSKMLQYYSESLKYKSAHWFIPVINFVYSFIHPACLTLTYQYFNKSICEFMNHFIPKQTKTFPKWLIINITTIDMKIKVRYRRVRDRFICSIF